MKHNRIICGLACMLLSFSTLAQSLDSSEVVHIRKLAFELYPAYSDRMTELFTMHQAMPSKDKVLMQRYDSLTSDSSFMGSSAYRTIAIDRALWAMVKGSPSAYYTSLKTAFGDVQMPEGLSPYHQEVSAIVLEYALEAGDFATAYRMQNALHAATYNDWKSEREALTDSMRNRESKQLGEIKALTGSQKELESRFANLRTIFMATGGALLLLCFVLLYLLLKRRKQLNHARSLADDTSEKEELVRKLESAKRELQQHLMAEKKRVEPVAAAVPEVSAPVVDLSGLNDEIQQGLAKIKGHCEAGKQGMSVPTYMSIVNDTTRLSSVVLKRIQALSSGQPKS